MSKKLVSASELGRELLPVLGLGGSNVVSLSIHLDGSDAMVEIRATMFLDKNVGDITEVFKKYNLILNPETIDSTTLEDTSKNFVQVKG